MTATLISAAGTVTLKGRAAEFAIALSAWQGELNTIPFGTLQFDFAANKRPLCRLTSTKVVVQDG